MKQVIKVVLLVESAPPEFGNMLTRADLIARLPGSEIVSVSEDCHTDVPMLVEVKLK